jgi:hypothetical protein
VLTCSHADFCRKPIVLQTAGVWRVTAKYRGGDMLPPNYSIRVLPQATADPGKSRLQGRLCLLRTGGRCQVLALQARP